LLLRRCAGSVIVDSQAKPTAITCAVDLHGSSSDTLGYAVLDGILNERLQQQVGNLRSEELGRDIDAHPEPLPKAHLLNIEIALQVLDLFLQCDLRPVGILG